jgi:hypothetical protein
MPTPKTPNLFDWATSELSQDAFICWLLSWANHPKNDGLYRTARMLVTEMTNDKLSTFKKIEIKKQLNRADVVCFIDEKDILIIEDKTGTREHSGQLKKYAESFGEKFSNRDLYLIYYKTEDQSDYSDVIKAGYTVWNREKILQNFRGVLKLALITRSIQIISHTSRKYKKKLRASTKNVLKSGKIKLCLGRFLQTTKN